MFGRNASEEPHAFNPEEVIESVIKLIGEQLRLDDIEVILEFMGKTVFVSGHEIQLEQVFLNIISNARYAILENIKNTKKKIRITGIVTDCNNVVVSITDTGGGVPDKIIAHIFTPFITSKPMGKGTGLGLSVSYGIISEMNGTITVENTDDGSCFKVTLPILLV
jgi:C4-dicarboxylate-specific signal transduction histidine kinase